MTKIVHLRQYASDPHEISKTRIQSTRAENKKETSRHNNNLIYDKTTDLNVKRVREDE